MQEALSKYLSEVEAEIMSIWILSMASDLQRGFKIGQGYYQEMSLDRGRTGEKHLKELGEVVLEGSGSLSTGQEGKDMAQQRFQALKKLNSDFFLPQSPPHPREP